MDVPKIIYLDPEKMLADQEGEELLVEAERVILSDDNKFRITSKEHPEKIVQEGKAPFKKSGKDAELELKIQVNA